MRGVLAKGRRAIARVDRWARRVDIFGPRIGVRALLYHRVADLAEDPHSLAVSPGRFYDQMDYVRKNYFPLNIHEFLEIKVNRRALPRDGVILTFDDGYADNFLNALPILESLSLQAVFFISTSKINSIEEFWWDELERILLVNPASPDRVEFTIAGRRYAFVLENRESKLHAYYAIHTLLRKSHPTERDSVLNSLRSWASLQKTGRDTHRVMTSHEISMMARSPSAVIGAHTNSHPVLSSLSYTEQYQEIEKSKSILESYCGTDVSLFSYPFGGTLDYDRRSIKACKEVGIRAAFTTDERTMREMTNDFRLPRLVVRSWDGGEFRNLLKWGMS